MPIVLLSDFGAASPYVGIMKGVIHKIAPKATLLDLAHDVPPFALTQAAWTLGQSLGYFPPGSIFVAVVDPGVGSTRRAILVKTEHYSLIGPDNGIFTLALERETPHSTFHLNQKDFFLPQISQTFHGRDIFAPVAAHLYNGVELGKLGTQVQDLQRLPQCFPRKAAGVWEGTLLAIDRFGNGITNFHRRYFPEGPPSAPWGLYLPKRSRPLKKWVCHYAEGKKGEILLLFGASGYLELSVREGSAADKLNLELGQALKLKKIK